MGAATKSEIRKIFTTRMWWALALAMAVLAFLLSMAAAAIVGDGGFGENAYAAQVIYTAGLLGNFGSLAALVPLALGVLLITNEYRHQTVTSTYLATPRRSVVALAKIAAVAVCGALFGVIHVIASIAGGALIMRTSKDMPLFLDNADVWQSLGMSVLATIVWMLLGFGCGMLLRNQVAAILLGVGFGLLGQLILNVLFALRGWDTAAKFIPGNLTTGMLVTGDPLQSGDGGSAPTFSWWICMLLLGGYALVLSAIGSVLTARRDIT